MLDAKNLINKSLISELGGKGRQEIHCPIEQDQGVDGRGQGRQRGGRGAVSLVALHAAHEIPHLLAALSLAYHTGERPVQRLEGHQGSCSVEQTGCVVLQMAFL